MDRLVRYEHWPGFQAVFLEDSFVLGWNIGVDSVTFELDVVLTEDHPNYRPPRQHEQYCYRRARLAFHAVQLLHWTQTASARATDSSGSADFGNIDALHQSGDRFLAEGDWGKLEVLSKRPMLVLRDESEQDSSSDVVQTPSDG